MKKMVLYLLISGSAMLIIGYMLKRNDFINRLLMRWKPTSIEVNSSEPVLAVFSFQAGAQNKILGQFIHCTIRLYDVEDWSIKKENIMQIADSIPLLITVETWGRNTISALVSNPLEDVVKGRYDYVVEKLCTLLIGTRPNVYFRFDPEMEVPSNRFPWQQYGGPSYIKAFSHFAALCQNFAPQVKQVWGPAGYPGTMEYYPGDNFVDAASVTLKSDSEKPLKVYPANYTVSYDLFRRLHRLRFIDKPIFILGSGQIAKDSINERLVSALTQKIDEERTVVYGKENFQRPGSNVRIDPQRPIEIGLYDPQSLLNQEKPVTVEHLFADFGNLHNKTFQDEFNKVIKRGHDIIVTFEPFRNPDGDTDQQILKHVAEGKYDREINQLYSILLTTNHRIYLRYAHEMEIPITRYPWQSQNPIDYIKSFRYFMTFKDPLPPTIKRIWGPAGDRGSLEWWPGQDVVDFISIAVYGLPDKNITDPEKQESFAAIFNRKYWRFRFVDKPVFITEFGVKGPEDYQTRWLEAAAKVIRTNPRIIGVNYFNMTDTPKAWGDIKPPDWSISKKTFYHFLKYLSDE